MSYSYGALQLETERELIHAAAESFLYAYGYNSVEEVSYMDYLESGSEMYINFNPVQGGHDGEPISITLTLQQCIDECRDVIKTANSNLQGE